jgi:hypothetical protein
MRGGLNRPAGGFREAQPSGDDAGEWTEVTRAKPQPPRFTKSREDDEHHGERWNNNARTAEAGSRWQRTDAPASDDKWKSVRSTAQRKTDVALEWFYRDPQGDTQGPFSRDQMKEWWENGFFTLSLPVRGSTDTEYFTLRTWFSGGQPAFLDKVPANWEEQSTAAPAATEAVAVSEPEPTPQIVVPEAASTVLAPTPLPTPAAALSTGAAPAWSQFPTAESAAASIMTPSAPLGSVDHQAHLQHMHLQHLHNMHMMQQQQAPAASPQAPPAHIQLAMAVQHMQALMQSGQPVPPQLLAAIASLEQRVLGSGLGGLGPMGPLGPMMMPPMPPQQMLHQQLMQLQQQQHQQQLLMQLQQQQLQAQSELSVPASASLTESKPIESAPVPAPASNPAPVVAKAVAPIAKPEPAAAAAAASASTHPKAAPWGQIKPTTKVSLVDIQQSEALQSAIAEQQEEEMQAAVTVPSKPVAAPAPVANSVTVDKKHPAIASLPKEDAERVVTLTKQAQALGMRVTAMSVTTAAALTGAAPAQPESTSAAVEAAAVPASNRASKRAAAANAAIEGVKRKSNEQSVNAAPAPTPAPAPAPTQAAAPVAAPVAASKAEPAARRGRNAPAPAPAAPSVWNAGATTRKTLREIQEEEALRAEIEAIEQAAAAEESPAPVVGWNARAVGETIKSFSDIQREQHITAAAQAATAVVAKSVVAPSGWGSVASATPTLREIQEQEARAAGHASLAAASAAVQSAPRTIAAAVAATASGPRVSTTSAVAVVAAPRAAAVTAAPVKSLREIQAEQQQSTKALPVGAVKSYGSVSGAKPGMPTAVSTVAYVEPAPVSAAPTPAPAPAPTGGLTVIDMQEEANTFWTDSQPAPKTAAPKGGKSGNAFGGPSLSREMEAWCKTEMTKLTGNEDTTLVTFLMTLDSAADIREYCHAYLGNTSQVDAFCDSFCAQRDFFLGREKKVQKPATKVATTGGASTASVTPAASSNAFGALSSSNSAGADAKKRRNRKKKGDSNDDE